MDALKLDVAPELPTLMMLANDHLSVIDRFEEVVRTHPDTIALSYTADQTPCDISYSRLDQLSNSVARSLQSRGLGAEHVVGIVADHNPLTIAGILGVMKAGACFLPVDPNVPADRAKRILGENNISVLLTLDSNDLWKWQHIDMLPLRSHIAAPSIRHKHVVITPDNAAYVIYTSGSTGGPKGVVVCHRALANHCKGFSDCISLSADDVILQFASLAFDAAYEEIFPCLCAGARLVIKAPDMSNDVVALMTACQDWQTTVLDLPTAFWRVLTHGVRDRALQISPSLRGLVIGGEEAPSKEVNYWAERYRSQIRLINTYGPTETTIIATFADLLEQAPFEEGEVPLGGCLPGLSITLQSRTPAGESTCDGEIYISGVGLARGYIGDPRLTAERFIPDANGIQGGRAYRTGDMARKSSNGGLQFKGRCDNQVKLNGYRIQLEEVERALLRHPEIAACAVATQDDRVGGTHLVAYCILETKDPSLPFQGNPLNVASLREFLSGILPAYMLPGQFSFLEKFILTSNGKIDRSKLPQIGYFDRRHRRLPDYQKPQPGLETALAKVWCEVLDLDPTELSAEDPFEYLGGNSLYSIQVTYKARQLGLAFKPLDMHLRQTIRGLASCCRTSKSALARAVETLSDSRRYLTSYCSVIVNDLKRTLASPGRPREFHYREIVENFYLQLENKHDILYIFFTTHLLHWLRATVSFVPADVNIVLIGSGLAPEEEECVRSSLNHPFLHLEQEVDLDTIWDILFEINRHNFGWLDPDCFIMAPSLFQEMRTFGSADAINCMWTHAACGPTKRPFHVIESYFLFFNIEAIKQLKFAGILPRPSAQVANLRQVRVLRKLIPADDLKMNPYMSVKGAALSNRLFKFEFDRLILFQLIANASGFKLNRVRFFTEIDTFNPYNYYSDEAIHVFPTIRQYDQTQWSGVDQKRRLSSDYLLMRSMISSLPPMYQDRLRFLESKFAEMEMSLEDLEATKASIRQYLSKRGVSTHTFARPELSWLAEGKAMGMPA
jgi:amino acid adenylation domain-containing protein